MEAAITENLREHPEANAALARKLMLAGRLESARENALLAQEGGPDWPQGYVLHAHCAIGFCLLPPAIQNASALSRSDVIEEGIAAAGKAYDLAQSQADTHVQAQALAARCELYLIAENKEAAAKDAKEAARLNPNDVGNLLAVAQTQLTTNKIELGITTLEQALEAC